MPRKPKPPRDSATAYARSVVAGEVPACKWVRLACERHLRDIASGRWYWDVAAAEKAIAFLRLLRHYKGEYAGKPFEPLPWQCFTVGSLFGWRQLESNLRRFRYSLVLVPRKNGKTFLGAGVGLCLLCGDGEPAAEVYSVATKEDQARLLWNDGKQMIRFSPGAGEVFRRTVSEIRHEDSASFWKPLGSDSETLDGLNPHGVLADELHAWKDRRLWDIMDSALGARRQPLVFAISTEGDVRDGIFDEQVKLAQSVLQDEALASGAGANVFALLFTIDDDDDPMDEATWFKANPNLGCGKSLEYMRDQAAKAKLSPGKLRDFLTKQLDVRQAKDANGWLSVERWDACSSVQLTPADAFARLSGLDVSGGLDLARAGDMTAAAFSARTSDGKVMTAWKYWLPEEGLRERCLRDGAPYDEWARRGWITLTPGNVTDFRVVESDIAELCLQFNVSALHFDPMGAYDLAMRLRDDHGVNVVEFRQTFGNFALPCREFERMVEGAMIDHGGNPVAQYNVANAVARTGPSGNVMPDKGRSRKRIDGLVAAIMATAGLIVPESGPIEFGAIFSR